jgi:iron complex outermembrane recepter protein
MRQFSSILKISAFLFLLSLSAFAQTGASVSGKVTYTQDQTPLHNATVQIVQLKRTIQTAEDGSYKIDNIPPGRYTILVHNDGFSDATRSIVLVANANSVVDFSLQIAGVNAQVTVTASGTEQSAFESFQSVTAVSSNTIAQRASSSIGEVLEREPGIAKRSFGSGSSRPVIRGFDGDRVLVAQDGIRSGSLGSQSGDHGEPIDTLGAERIEVVKGPATLLYGSNAIGGVVNVISNHEDDVHTGLRGYLTGVGGTANSQFGSSGGIEYGYKKFMGWGNGSFQNADDFSTPLGRIPNTASRSTSGSGGAGYYADKGFFTGQFNYDRRRYGIPYGALFEEYAEAREEGDDSVFNPFAPFFGLPPRPAEDIDLKMRTYNIRLNGGFRDINSFVTSGKFTFNFNRYRHQELEIAGGDEEIGTTFNNRTASYRGVFEQKKVNRLTGRFGFDGYDREYETIGAEQLIDGAVKQNMLSAFALEELNFGRVSFQFGGRVENNRFRPENNTLINRNFTGFSGAAGVRVGLWKDGAFVANYTNSYRAPALEELYNFGPHVGNVTFEIGNQNLQRERANGIDFGLRHQSNRFTADFNVYYYGIKNFVYLAFADEDGDGEIDIEDGLPAANYFQGDSRYLGAEFNATASINKYFGLYASGDIVRARLTDVNLNLPRIPPARLQTGLDFKYKGLNVRPEGVFVNEQTRLYPLETRTAGYGLFNVTASYIIGTEHYAHIFGVNGYNLTDKLYRNHLSFIKELAPEMGRGVRVSYTVRFF